MTTSQIVNNQIRNLTIQAAKMAGSIPDSKLNQLTTADKVAGSAVQLASTSALEDSSGLRIKSAIAGAALSLSGSQVLEVNIDNSSVGIDGSDQLYIKPSGITNAMLAGSIADAKLATDYIQAAEVDGSSVEFVSDVLRVKALGITDAMLAGSISNSKLSNSSVSFAGQSASLGGSVSAADLAGALDLSEIGAPSAAVAMNSQKITGMADPTNAQDAATKAYVDATKQGLSAKDSVRVATTANITLSGTQTIDGVSVVADDRVLVKDQSSGAENGIYVCAAGAWSRAADMDAQAEFEAGAYFFVEEGNKAANSGFVLTTDGAITVDTTELAFTQFSGAGQIVAGAAMSKSGNQLDVEVDDSSIEVSSDALQVKALGITNAMLAGSIADGKLAEDYIKVNEVDNSSLQISSNTLQVKALGITNAMLAGSIANAKLSNSTISGVALGGTLGQLSAGNGLSMTAYDGSTAVSDLTVAIDGSTLSKSGSGLKVADGGIGTTQVAATSITLAKLGYKLRFSAQDGDGTSSAFDLPDALHGNHTTIMVARNGVLLEPAETPSTVDQYSVSENGGSGGVGQVTFGAAPASSDRLTFYYLA